MPDGDATALAPLLCGGVIGFRSLRVAGIGPQSAGARLGLYGFGASATIAIQVANYWGCEVHVVTRSPRRCSGPTTSAPPGRAPMSSHFHTTRRRGDLRPSGDVVISA